MDNRSDRWRRNRDHWSSTLDAQNLRADAAPIALETQLQLAETVDVEEAFRHLEPLRGRTILDLGGGLGLTAMLLSQRGAHVVIADISLPRLREARRLLHEAGYGGTVSLLQCTAEQLPFLDDSLDRQFTKSVLIHTQLPVAAGELARTLSHNGRAAFVEPTTGNPFVNLYRRLGAPGIWASITDYFTTGRIQTLRTPFRRHRSAVGHRCFLAFFASPFNYSLHHPLLFRLVETPLDLLDRALFRFLPFLKKRAWFCIVKISPRQDKP